MRVGRQILPLGLGLRFWFSWCEMGSFAYVGVVGSWRPFVL